MDLVLSAKSLQVIPSTGRDVEVSLEVEESEVISHFEIQSFIDHFCLGDVIEHIGLKNFVEQFGESDVLDHIGQDSAVEHFEIELAE